MTRFITVAIGLSFLIAPDAFAQQPAYRNQPNTYYDSSSRSLEGLAEQLDTLALQTRNQAKMDRGRGHTEEMTERLDAFANHAHQFRTLLRDHHVPSSKINDEIRRLVDDARNVQVESSKATLHDPQVEADWNATLAALDNLNRQYLALNGLQPAPLDIPGYVHNPAYNPGYGAIGTSGSEAYGAPGERALGSRGVLIGDLDRRADDAVRVSQNGYVAAAPDILRLRDEVRAFRQRADRSTPAGDRPDIGRLLADARNVQAEIANQQVPPQLRDDVSAMVGTLVHLRDMSYEGESGYDQDRDRDRMEGTGGYAAAPGVAADRYAMMGRTELTRELHQRVARASDIAHQADMDDVSSDIGHFSDRLRDFERNSASMDRDDRRAAIDSLLQDAQRTQRDMARRNAPADLTNQWNAVVDLVARLGNAE